MKKLILVFLTLSVILLGKEITTKENEILLLLEGKIELNSNTCYKVSYQAVETLTAKIGEKAVEIKLKKLCNLGCGTACKRGGYGYKKACESKYSDGFACYHLNYDEKDEKKKFELQDKGCKAGYLLGCYYMAGHFADAMNYGLALKYYNIGCDKGDDESCGTLGMIYATGKYGEVSPQKAYEYWSKSLKLNPANGASYSNLRKFCKNHPSICK